MYEAGFTIKLVNLVYFFTCRMNMAKLIMIINVEYVTVRF